MRRTKLVELFWRLHPVVYRATGGRVLGRVLGMPVLLLETRGRRSGSLRTTALTYHAVDGQKVVIGSFLGEPRHPAWVHNLRSEPRAQIQIGRRHQPVIAREAQGSEREQLWSEVVRREPSYADYAERTTRRIPVVILEPVAEGGRSAEDGG